MATASSPDLSAPVYSTLADDPDFRELLELFVQSAPEKREALRAAFDADRWDDLQREAHRLKGAAAGYGFADLTFLAARLEQACRTNSRAQVASPVADVRDYLARLRV